MSFTNSIWLICSWHQFFEKEIDLNRIKGKEVMIMMNGFESAIFSYTLPTILKSFIQPIIGVDLLAGLVVSLIIVAIIVGCVLIDVYNIRTKKMPWVISFIFVLFFIDPQYLGLLIIILCLLAFRKIVDTKD